jgi:MoaA/NifB/PqqE/SkfB family radical SAM enzyme
MTWHIDSLKAPLFVSWQITRDCDLCCLHCCTESAPGKRLPDELAADEAMALADQIVRNEVPYVMLCGGEPLVAPYFLALAEALGQGGVQLKIETNGQNFDAGIANRLARLPIRSIQISLDADTPDVYGRQRPGDRWPTPTQRAGPPVRQVRWRSARPDDSQYPSGRAGGRTRA